MNMASFERAQVAAFAYREARHTGSLDCMRAICFILRNRVKAGWGDGSWLSVLAATDDVCGNLERLETKIDPTDRLLGLILRDIDDIYLGQESWGDSVRLVTMGDDPPKTSSLYYSFVDGMHRHWFVHNIIQRPADHPHVGNIGTMMLFK